jgi:hypothetical protein
MRKLGGGRKTIANYALIKTAVPFQVEWSVLCLIVPFLFWRKRKDSLHPLSCAQAMIRHA